jgi:hypothetical protein
MTQKEDETFRLSKYTAHFLETFSRMYRLREPDEEMISLYTKRFQGVHLSHLVNSFEICYEQFKDAGRYPSPDEVMIHVADEKRLIANQESGPIRVSGGNQRMLEIFIKAFRESKLKGEELESYLNGIVEENYPKLCSKRPEPVCKVCKDRGCYRVWFLCYIGQKRQRATKDAWGKSAIYTELERVPNGPIWMQETQPDIETPNGQGLSDGFVRCDCANGDLFSFPKMEAVS